MTDLGPGCGSFRGKLGPQCKVAAVSSRAQLRIQVGFPGHRFMGIQCVALSNLQVKAITVGLVSLTRREPL